LNLTACGSSSKFPETAKDKSKIMTVKSNVGTESVKYSEYRYFFMNSKSDLYGADAALNIAQTEKLKALTENNIKMNHAVSLAAKKHGVNLTADEKKTVEGYTESVRKSEGLDENGYKLMLEENFATDTLFTELYRNQVLEERLYEKLLEEGTLPSSADVENKAFKSDEIICIKEIFFEHLGGDTVEITRKLANEKLGKLKAGESFDKLCKESLGYSIGGMSAEHGYYTFDYDQNTSEEIWNIAVNLKVGEYSEVVESSYGFHIIMRCEKDYDYMEKNKKDIIQRYQQSKFNKYLTEFMEDMTLEYTDNGKSLDLSKMS